MTAAFRYWFTILLTLLALAPVGASPWQPFTALAVSNDGRRLATGSLAGEVLIWESLTGEVLRKVVVGSTPIVGLAYGSEGTVLGVASLSGSFVLTVATGAVVPADFTAPAWKSLRSTGPVWLEGRTSYSGVSAQRGTLTAQGFPDGRLEIRQGETGIPHGWQAHSAAVTGLAWSPDGKVLYSVSADGTLARWDAETGKELGRL